MPIEILPALATPAAGETIQFKCPTAEKWRVVPDVPVGTVDEQPGILTYAAPLPIMGAGQFAIIALDASDKELARAQLNLEPTQLKIHPEKVEDLRSRDSVEFTVKPVGLAQKVTWESSDKSVPITPGGVMTAPECIATARTLTVTAKWEDAGQKLFSSATVRLSDHNFKVRLLAGYTFGFALLLLSLVVWLVKLDCADEKSPGVNLIPPILTLKAGDTYQFQARFACLSNTTDGAVLWQSTAGEINNGFLRANLGTNPPPRTVTVTATSKSDSCDIATATVVIASDGLQIVPPFARISERQSYQFDIAQLPAGGSRTNYSWQIFPEQGAGAVTEDGLYMAPSEASPVRHARIVARLKADPRIQAAALVELSCAPKCGKAFRQLLFILILGALGSTIYCMSSIGDYVGNGKFVPSWFLFYLFKPVIGAALAYVVVAQGALKVDSGSLSIGWGALAALVGLFSDKAMLKLAEIANTLFGTSVKPAGNDGRGDKLNGSARPTTPPSGAPVLRTALLSNELLTLAGDYFTADCKVKIGDVEREAKIISAHKLQVVLTAEDLAQTTLKVAVVNKAKQISETFEVTKS